jgi:hypothetical protein
MNVEFIRVCGVSSLDIAGCISLWAMGVIGTLNLFGIEVEYRREI